MADFKQMIKTLRQEKGWTQAELGKKINIHQKQISAYENGRYTPSTDVLIKLSEVFNVSLDYIVFGIRNGEEGRVQIKDRELLQQTEMLDKMNEKDRSLAKELIKLFALKKRVEGLLTEEELNQKIAV